MDKLDLSRPYRLEGVTIPCDSACASCLHLPDGVTWETPGWASGLTASKPLTVTAIPGVSPLESRPAGRGGGFLCYRAMTMPEWSCGMYVRETGSDDGCPTIVHTKGLEAGWYRH